MLIRLLLAIIARLHHLPFGLVAGLGSSLGAMAYWLIGSRRRVVLRNLELCFPELSADERIDLAKRHFRAVGRSFIERTYPFHAPPERLEKVVALDGVEFIDGVIDRPIILLAPHFVGLDMACIRLSMRYKMTGIYSKQKSSIVDDWLFEGRSRFNEPAPISRQQGIRALIRQMKPGIPVFYLPDLDYGKRDSVFVPFFGIPTATITGLSRLAKLTGAAVLPVIAEQTPTGYIAHIHPAWKNFPTNDPVADAIYMNRFLEEEIRKMPEQYYWVHRRFKSRPSGHPPLY